MCCFFSHGLNQMVTLIGEEGAEIVGEEKLVDSSAWHTYLKDTSLCLSSSNLKSRLPQALTNISIFKRGIK